MTKKRPTKEASDKRASDKRASDKERPTKNVRAKHRKQAIIPYIMGGLIGLLLGCLCTQFVKSKERGKAHAIKDEADNEIGDLDEDAKKQNEIHRTDKQRLETLIQNKTEEVILKTAQIREIGAELDEIDRAHAILLDEAIGLRRALQVVLVAYQQLFPKADNDVVKSAQAELEEADIVLGKVKQLRFGFSPKLLRRCGLFQSWEGRPGNPLHNPWFRVGNRDAKDAKDQWVVRGVDLRQGEFRLSILQPQFVSPAGDDTSCGGYMFPTASFDFRLYEKIRFTATLVTEEGKGHPAQHFDLGVRLCVSEPSPDGKELWTYSANSVQRFRLAAEVHGAAGEDGGESFNVELPFSALKGAGPGNPLYQINKLVFFVDSRIVGNLRQEKQIWKDGPQGPSCIFRIENVSVE